MNFAKRAYLYLYRKKGKTLFLFVVLLILSTMMLTCTAIHTATQKSITNVRKALRSYFTINAKLLSDGLDGDVLHQILSIKGIGGDYILRSYTKANYFSSSKEKLEIEIKGLAAPEGDENAGKIVATNDSKKDSYFTEGGFELLEGEHITERSEHRILVHEDFAKKNRLSVGDSIILENAENSDLNVEVVVQGIFTNAKEQDSDGLVPSYDLYENVAFTDVISGSCLIFGKKEAVAQYADLYVDDPEDLNSIITDVKEISGVDWEKCVITKYDNDYQNAKNSLISLQNIIVVAMVVVSIVGFVVLALILILGIRNRMSEIGILLSMGISKIDIFKQQLLEIFFIAVLALTVSYISSSVVAGQIGKFLLSETTTEEYKVIDLKKDDTEVVLNNDNLHEELGLLEVKVTVSAEDYFLVWVLGLELCSLATGMALIPIIKLKPKKILSQIC